MEKIFLIICLFLSFSANSSCKSEVDVCYYTKFGNLEQQDLTISNEEYSHITLNGVEIYKTKTDYISFLYEDLGFMKNDKYYVTKTVISSIPKTLCQHNDFRGHCTVSVVLDFSEGKPIISNEFIPDSGQSNIDWVSWGKANSIIVFTDGSKFKYENGRVERIVDKK